VADSSQQRGTIGVRDEASERRRRASESTRPRGRTAAPRRRATWASATYAEGCCREVARARTDLGSALGAEVACFSPVALSVSLSGGGWRRLRRLVVLRFQCQLPAASLVRLPLSLALSRSLLSLLPFALVARCCSISLVVAISSPSLALYHHVHSLVVTLAVAEKYRRNDRVPACSPAPRSISRELPSGSCLARSSHYHRRRQPDDTDTHTPPPWRRWCSTSLLQRGTRRPPARNAYGTQQQHRHHGDQTRNSRSLYRSSALTWRRRWRWR